MGYYFRYAGDSAICCVNYDFRLQSDRQRRAQRSFHIRTSCRKIWQLLNSYLVSLMLSMCRLCKLNVQRSLYCIYLCQ